MKLIQIQGKLINPSLITYIETIDYLGNEVVLIHFSGGDKLKIEDMSPAYLLDKLTH